MKENIRIVNGKIEFTSVLLGGSITNSFNNLVVDEDNTVESLDLLNYFNATSFTATSSSTDLVNVSINNTNLDITLVQNAYSNAANSLNQGELLSFTIPNDYQGELKYFCYTHSSMIANFTIEDTPVDTSSINTKFYVRLNSDPFSSPYYIFSSTENGTSLDVVLYRGISYEFERTDSGHPFNIGSNHNENTTGIVITSNGTGGIVYSEALITVSATDGSTTVDQSFKIKVNPINDEATGTVIFTDNVIINQTITATVNLTDNDGPLTLGYQWQVSDDNSTFTNTDSTDLTFIIPSDYVGKYIRLQVSSVDSEGGVSVVNSYSRQVNDVFGDIQVNTTSSNTVIKLENTHSLNTDNTFDGEVSLYYSNFASTNTDIVPTLSSTWDQIGSSIFGENEEDKLGNHVSLSTDGSILALGAANGADNGIVGSVRVFEYINNEWTQKGSTLEGENDSDHFGNTAFISGDGTKLFITSPLYSNSFTNQGKLYIYTFNSSNNDWNLVNSIEGTYENHSMGILISDDGNVFAINKGVEDQIYVYNYNYNDDTYSQKGSTIACNRVFSLSGDGNHVAVANDFEYNVEVYTYDSSQNGWINSSTVSISYNNIKNLEINYDGTVFMYSKDSVNNTTGINVVYEYKNNSWNQLGSDINGIQEVSWGGWRITMNKSGKLIATLDVRYNSGTIRILRYNPDLSDWVEVKRISGDGKEEGIGLQLSSDGTRLASGSRDFTNELYAQGRVEVYELNNELTLADVNSLTIGSSTDISFDVTDGTETQTKTFTVSNIDDPTFGELRIISNTTNLYEGGTLTADTSSITDPDGIINFTYEWEISNSSDFIEFSPITSATNSSFTIPKDSESSFSYVGQYIRLKVYDDNNTEYISDPRLVLNIEDEATGTVSFTSDFNLILEESLLTAVTNVSDTDNNRLITDTNNVGSLTLSYQWQISDDNNTFTNIDTDGTASTYKIPLGVYDKYIRLSVTTTDIRGGTTEILSSSSLIEKLNLVTQTSISDSNYLEGNDYVFDLSSIIFNNFDVSFSIKTDDVNGSSTINNNLLTFTPNNSDYYGESTVVVTASSPSITTITQDITFTINIQPVDDEATGTVTFTDNVLVNQTITASVNLTDNDGSLTLSYQWQVSDDNSTFTNTDSTDLTFVIPSDYVGKYIRLEVSSVDSEGGVSVVNSYSRQVKDVFGDIQVNTTSDNTVIKLEETFYKSYYVFHHTSDGSWENLFWRFLGGEGEKMYNEIKDLNNYYITIPDFSGDTIYTYSAFISGAGSGSYFGLRLRDPDGNKPVLSDNTYYTLRVHSFSTNILDYSNAISSDSNIVPTITSLWEQIGSSIYGGDSNDQLGKSVFLSGDGSVVALTKENSIEVYEKNNDNWVQKGGSISLTTLGRNDAVNTLSKDGNTLLIYKYGYDGNKIMFYVYKFRNDVWEELTAKLEIDIQYVNFNISKDCNVIAIGDRINNNVNIYKLADNELTFDQYGNTINDSIFRFGWNVSLSENGDVVMISNMFRDTNVDSNLYGAGFIDVYYYNNGTWTQKGSRIYKDKSKFEEIDFEICLNSTGNVFSIGNWNEDNYILKMVPANTNASTILSEYINAGYSLHTAYYGNSLNTDNLLNGTIYDSLNDGKLLNINDYNKVRYDIASSNTISVAIVNGDFETDVIIENSYSNSFTPPGWTENGNNVTILVKGIDNNYLGNSNTEDNSMIGFRGGRRLYQEITGYKGFYTLTFDLIKRTIGDALNLLEPTINVLINNEVKLDEEVSNETIEQRTITWFNDEEIIRIEFATIGNSDKTFFIDNVAVSYIPGESVAIVNGDFETDVFIENSYVENFTPPGWTENGTVNDNNRVMVNGIDSGYLGSTNTEDNSMIGFRQLRRLYQEITGNKGFYTLTFDLIKRTVSASAVNIPNINVLINNEVKLDEQVSNETIEQRTITWYNDEDTIRIEFASTDPTSTDATFFIDNVAVIRSTPDTSYFNDIYNGDDTNDANIENLLSNTNTYAKISGFFSPIENGYYRLVSKRTADGIRLRIREFTSDPSDLLENYDDSLLPLFRIKNATDSDWYLSSSFTNFFKYSMFDWTGDYDLPYDSASYISSSQSSTPIIWGDHVGIDYTLTTDTTNILIRMEFVFSVNEDGLYNIRCHSITGIRIKIVDYNDPAPNSNDSNDWPELDDYSSSGYTNWETKHNRYSHNLQINLQKNKIYKCYIENVRGESYINGGLSNVFVGITVNKNTTDTLGYPENKGTDYDIQDHPNFTIYDTKATYDTTNNEWVDLDSFSSHMHFTDVTLNNIYLDSAKYYEFLIERVTPSGDPSFSIYAEKSNTDEFTSHINDINTEFVSLINLKSRFQILKEILTESKFRYDVYNSLSDMTNNGKTEYRNELLSWTGYQGDVTNLNSIIGDFGDDIHVSIRITGYFSPVVTTDYRFRFVDNDDAIGFFLVEFGNDINSGGISLTRLIEGNRTETSDPITLNSTKTYEFKMIWMQASGFYKFEPQVEIGNSGTFVDFYDKNNFTFKSSYELTGEDISFISSEDVYNLPDPNVNVPKFTYYVFKSEKVGSTSIYEYDDTLNEWYQLGNTIYNSPTSLEPQDDNSGALIKLTETGKVIAITEPGYENGNVKVMQYNPYGTSIANIYGNGIDSDNTILANNQKLYQGSYITSPNGNYVLNFQESNGNLVLRYNSDPTIYSVETDYDNFDVKKNFWIQDTISEGNPNTYIVMEDGNLNIYDNGQHKYSYTTNAKSGVLSLDNNGNLSIVENWTQNGNNITGLRSDDNNGLGMDISYDGLTLAVGTKNYDGVNNDTTESGLLRIYNFSNELTLGNVNSLSVDSSTDISFNVSDGNLIDTKTFTVSNIDDTPIGEVRILSNTINLYEGGTLTADTTSLTDPDGTVSITSYQWEISSDSSTYTSITDATNSTFTIPRDTESSFSYVGQYIRLKVIDNGTEIYSDPKLVLNIEDEATGTLSFTSNITLIQEGAILTAVTNLSDVDNNKLISNNSEGTLTLAYQWQVSEDNTSFTNISGATSNEYQIPVGTYTGQYIRLFITTTDRRGGTTDFVTTSSLIEVNNSPFFNTNPITTSYVGILYSYSFTFSDADENQTISITDISYPSWITFDANNNTLSGTPTENDFNDKDVSITISDGTNETIQSFSIYVNRAPYIGTDLNLTFDEDEVINPIDLDLYFSDYDNDTLNYTIDSYDTNFFAASIDSDRKLNLVLVANKFGTSDITITATDGYNSVTHTGTIAINSVNDDPTGTVTIVGITLPNKELSVDLTQITDIENDPLTYTYLWQMSSDSDSWDSSTDVGTSSTYTIPDTNDNENKYIRVIVTIEDSDTNNNDFVSNVVQIQKIDLITSFSESNTINEDNDYTFDLSSIINTDYDVSFEVKTDDTNGTSVIDINKLLTFTPDTNYNGSSSFIITASTDSSVTSITQDITFNITINPINDQPTGTVVITGITLPNNELSVDLTQITDVENDTLTYSFLWQMSSNTNVWDSSSDVATSSTYTIPDTNDNENKYIRVKVNVKDSDDTNTEFISDEVQIQKLDLVTSFTINESVNEDNDYVFDLSSIINNNYDVSFELKTDDVNGTSVIDSNKLLTFTPNENYNGGSTIILTASTDTSVTSITQDITFNITVISVNDEPTGTVLIEGNALLNDTLSAILDISDIENDVLEYSYSWEISNDENNWENSIVVGTESSYKIAENIDYVGQYIRLIVSIKDSDTNDNKIISSNILEISNVRLVANDTINETIQEDNNYIYDLNSVKDTNHNVYFTVNNVLNGQVSIDENDILTFIPDTNYFGNATILLDVTTDHSITTMTQSLSFNLTIVSVNDEPTGPITILGTTLPNKELSVDLSQIVDVENDALTYNFLWQMSSDNNIWQNIGTSSTYTIPDTNDNENKYLRVIVTIEDSDTNNNEIISNVIQIQKLDLITSFSENNTINEDNDYTFDLSSIINTDYDVSFEVKTDDTNGTSVIDINKLLTFTPDTNYNGSSTIVITASTDSSITSITQDITFNIIVNSINDQPTGTITITGVILPNNELSVDLTQITDVENDTLTYSFLWQMSSDTNVWDSSNDVATSSTYTIPDTNDNENKYIRVKVNVKDSDDINTEFISDVVQIQKLDLVTSFTINESVNEDNDYTFDLSSIINNNYDVSFELKTDDVNGTSVIDSNKLLTFTPNQQYYGQSTITVTASTETSVTSITQDITFNITVNSVNDRPVFNDGSFITDEDVSTTFDLSSLTSDVENDSLTYTIITEPSKGSASIEGSILTFVPTENLSGSDSIEVSVSDGELSSTSTISITINAVNDAPVFNDGSFTTNEDTEATYDLSVLASDVDSNSLNYSIVTGPSKGIASIEGSILTYNPELNYSGSDSIEVSVSDGILSSTSTISIFVNPINDAPVFNNGFFSTDEDTPTSFDLSSLISDVENDLLTYTIVSAATKGTSLISGSNLLYIPFANLSGSDSVQVSVTDGNTTSTSTISITINPVNDAPKIDNGSFSVNEAIAKEFDLLTLNASDVDNNNLTYAVKTLPSKGNVSINNTTLTYKSYENEYGADSFVITVSDGELFTEATIDVLINAVPKVLNNFDDLRIEENSVDYIVDLSDKFVDADDTSLTYSATSNNTNLINVSVLGDKLTLSLAPNSKGETTIDVSATDNEVSVTNSFSVLVFRENELPVFDSTPVTVAYEDLLYEYNVQVSDVNVEDSSLTIEIIEKPNWLTFINNEYNRALLSGTPLVDHIGTHNVVLKVTDTVLESATQSFTITVIEVNDNPTFVSEPITEVDERSEYVYNIVVNDEENDNVSITVDTALIPSWLSLTQIDNNNAVLTGTPGKFDSGEYNIIITATDEHGKSNSQVFTLTVNNVNFPPVITSTPILYTLAHNLYTYTVIVDHDGEIDFEATKIPYWATFTDNNDNTATLTGIPDINENFTVNIVIKEVGGLRTTINHDFSIKVDAEPYVKNAINDISIVTFDKFEYKLPEFNNRKYTNENTVSMKKSNLVKSDNWIFYDDSYNTVIGDTLSYELFIDDNLVDTYDWITFTNGSIKIHPKFHHIGNYVFKLKTTDMMGSFAETEFNVKINSSVIKFEKQFYNNNRKALVELDTTDSTDALNKVHNYLDTHNLSQEKYNVIIFNSDENKVQIYEGDNNNHTISDHDSIDTYVISKYLDNVRRTKQSIVIRPNKNLNIELL